MISSSKKIIPILLLIVIFLTSCGVKSSQEELGVITEGEYQYKEAYYLRTTFADQTFEVVSDFEMSNKNWFHLATIPQKMTETERNVASMYSEKFPPHSVILRYLSASERNRRTEGKSIYTDSFTITSIIIPTNSETAPFGYVFTKIEDTPTDINVLLERALYDFNGIARNPDQLKYLEEMPQSDKESFDKYLKGYEVYRDE